MHCILFVAPCSAADWLGRGEVQKLVVVITGVETKEVLERWVLNIETDKAALTPGWVIVGVGCRRC